jgi:23S rRNA pseudouridine1911/1915/1917 synthase
VQGSTSESFSIEDAIEGREAVTYFEKVREVSSTKAGILTELKCYPQTGRKNQIRIHLSNSGLPIYGDQRFGGERSGRGLLLFAEAISFTHPESGERIELSVDLPRKFERIMRSQKKRSPN